MIRQGRHNSLWRPCALITSFTTAQSIFWMLSRPPVLFCWSIVGSGAAGRFSDASGTYTSSEHPAENTRGIKTRASRTRRNFWFLCKPVESRRTMRSRVWKSAFPAEPASPLELADNIAVAHSTEIDVGREIHVFVDRANGSVTHQELNHSARVRAVENLRLHVRDTRSR